MKGDLCISWKSCKCLWSKLSWMKIKWLVENIWVGYETELFTIMDNIISFFLLNFLEINNWSSAWWSNLLGSSACICLIWWNNWITDIEYQESISSLVHHHNIVTESQFAIFAICMRYSCVSLREIFLNFVNDQFSLIFLIKVISLTMTGQILIFWPITNSCTMAIFWSSW